MAAAVDIDLDGAIEIAQWLGEATGLPLPGALHGAPAYPPVPLRV